MAQKKRGCLLCTVNNGNAEDKRYLSNPLAAKAEAP